MFRALIRPHHVFQPVLIMAGIEAEDMPDDDEGEMEGEEHENMAEIDASDASEDDTMATDPNGAEDGAPDDAMEVPREGYRGQ